MTSLLRAHDTKLTTRIGWGVHEAGVNDSNSLFVATRVKAIRIAGASLELIEALPAAHRKDGDDALGIGPNGKLFRET